MARRKKRRSRRARGRKCQIVTVCGRRRRICRTAKGRITSNTAVGGKRRSKKRGKKRGKRRCKFGVNKRTGNCLKTKRRRR